MASSVASKFRVGTFNNISRVGLSRFRQSAYQIGALDSDEAIKDPVRCFFIVFFFSFFFFRHFIGFHFVKLTCHITIIVVFLSLPPLHLSLFLSLSHCYALTRARSILMILYLPNSVKKFKKKQQAILIRSHKLQVSEIPKSVCAIARCGAGTNNIPVSDLSARGIPVFNTPGANANAVKELVLCGLLLASRRVHQGINHVIEVAESEGTDVAIGRVEKDKKLFAGQELSGKTLGVIGLGAIGASVANAASALGMKVIGYDPYITVESALSLNFKGTQLQMANSMETVMGAADYLSLHAPVIKGVTEGMINRQALESMRPGCNIINFARGELVDGAALKAAFDADIFKGTYVSDFPDKHLLGHPNVIGMPHLGASTEEAEENSSSMAADTIMSFLETGSVVNSVNFPTIKTEPKSENIAVRACIVNENRKGMLQEITNAFSEFNVARAQNESRDDISYNLIDLEDMPGDLDGLMKTVTGIDGVLSARFIVSTDGDNSRYKLNRDNSLM